MSTNQAEREIVIQGFREQLEIVEQSQIAQEQSVKAKLYDIITDNLITEEEKHSIEFPYLKILEDLEERHIRIRRSIFIGLYSFWEVSLMNMSDCQIANSGNTVQEQTKKNLQKKRLGASDYLSIIYGENIPESVDIINNNIRELRNYMVHGSNNPKRKEAIEELMEKRSEFHIKVSAGEYYFDDYEGLIKVLDSFERELNDIENNEYQQ
ncbi:MAG: hypothetical protein NC453_15255 [Muribaculum sp.]|nr:hypothetical protein [Muribaculum sp.]